VFGTDQLVNSPLILHAEAAKVFQSIRNATQNSKNIVRCLFSWGNWQHLYNTSIAILYGRSVTFLTFSCRNNLREIQLKSANNVGDEVNHKVLVRFCCLHNLQHF
jgi:hypothetical protein